MTEEQIDTVFLAGWQVIYYRHLRIFAIFQDGADVIVSACMIKSMAQCFNACKFIKDIQN